MKIRRQKEEIKVTLVNAEMLTVGPEETLILIVPDLLEEDDIMSLIDDLVLHGIEKDRVIAVQGLQFAKVQGVYR